MSQILDEVLAANASYAAGFDKGGLPMPPGRHFAILTCMDARLDPAKYAGLSEGDAHVIRNAGGRASDDAIRSLVISYKLLGTREWFVIHHTDCGMETFTDDIMRGLLASSLKTASVDATGWHDSGEGPGSTEGNYIDWLTIKDNARSVVEDVARIRNHPLVPGSIPIYGYIYDVKSGQLVEVPAATEAGRPTYPVTGSGFQVGFRKPGADGARSLEDVTASRDAQRGFRKRFTRWGLRKCAPDGDMCRRNARLIRSYFAGPIASSVWVTLRKRSSNCSQLS